MQGAWHSPNMSPTMVHDQTFHIITCPHREGTFYICRLPLIEFDFPRMVRCIWYIFLWQSLSVYCARLVDFPQVYPPVSSINNTDRHDIIERLFNLLALVLKNHCTHTWIFSWLDILIDLTWDILPEKDYVIFDIGNLWPAVSDIY